MQRFETMRTDLEAEENRLISKLDLYTKKISQSRKISVMVEYILTIMMNDEYKSHHASFIFA